MDTSGSLHNSIWKHLSVLNHLPCATDGAAHDGETATAVAGTPRWRGPTIHAPGYYTGDAATAASMRLIPRFVNLSTAFAITPAVCGLSHWIVGYIMVCLNGALDSSNPSHSVFLLEDRAGPTCRVTNMACPMCSRPVTLAGGMAMVKGSPVAESSGAKNPCSSHLRSTTKIVWAWYDCAQLRGA